MNIRPRSTREGRTKLCEKVPLDTPYVLGIYTGDVCNFKCVYCAQTIESSRGGQLRHQFMNWDTFEKAVLSLKEFPRTIKKCIFSSIGEPLLHKDLPRMIHFIKELGVVDSIEVVTNGALLTHSLSEALVNSGLNRLVVSIQGITAKSYQRISKVNIDFSNLVRELAYFFSISRGNCLLHIKTVDLALNEGESEEFFKLFSSIADTIFVDRVIEAFQGVDYTGLISDHTRTLYGNKALYRLVCPTVFYTLYVLSNGDVTTCCSPPYPLILGNVYNTGLRELWLGKNRTDFLRLQLKGKRLSHVICKGCIQPFATAFPEDNLDENRLQILKRLGR